MGSKMGFIFDQTPDNYAELFITNLSNKLEQFDRDKSLSDNYDKKKISWELSGLLLFAIEWGLYTFFGINDDYKTISERIMVHRYGLATHKLGENKAEEIIDYQNNRRDMYFSILKNAGPEKLKDNLNELLGLSFATICGYENDETIKALGIKYFMETTEEIMETLNYAELDANSFKWDEFTGKKNIKAIVLDKASALARNMSSLLARAIKEMQQGVISETKIKVEDKQWWSVYYNFLLYMMHIADREAFEYLNKSMRKVFVRQLLKKVIEVCIEDFANYSRAHQFRQNFEHNFMLFQKEFASYERGQTNHLTENLTYMFAKRIQKRLGLDRDLILNLQFFQFSTKLEFILDIPRLLIDTNEMN